MTTPAHPAHPPAHPTRRIEAFSSIGIALLLSVAAGVFFFRWGNWEPTEGGSKLWYYALAWIVLAYLAAQLVALLLTAIDSRSIGFGDTVCSILPAIVGAVVLVEYFQKYIELSTFALNALMLMICTSGLEALITLWVRFTVNRRTIGIDPGSF